MANLLSGIGSSNVVQVTSVTASSALVQGLTTVNSASATTQTLPTAVGITGQQFIVKNINTGTVTVATTSSQTIDGGSTAVIYNQYTSLTFVSDGTNWNIT